jgi:Na+/melibiose symporter-like transporter
MRLYFISIACGDNGSVTQMMATTTAATMVTAMAMTMVTVTMVGNDLVYNIFMFTLVVAYSYLACQGHIPGLNYIIIVLVVSDLNFDHFVFLCTHLHASPPVFD